MDPTTDPHLDGAETSGDYSGGSSSATASNYGWQKVTYPKRQRRQIPAAVLTAGDHPPNGIHHLEGPNVFAFVEQKAQERRRAMESVAAASAVPAAGSTHAALAAASDDDEVDTGIEGAAGAEQENTAKEIKQKKPKKPKVTVQEAASKIDAADLSHFLADVSVSYESQQDIQLMRFADFFGRAFSAVSASQFPWTKMFKESPVAKIIDVPLCHISEQVFKVSGDWIAKKSPEVLGDFVLWCLDGILADLESQQVTAKGSKKITQKSPSKSQVAIFVVLAMTLRKKPDLLVSLMPKLRDNPKYQGQEKVPVAVWTISQASRGELVVGLHGWAHYLLPVICGRSGNPLTRGLTLQLIECILAVPKARSILLNGAVRKGERLVPPSSLDLLMQSAFPVYSARLKVTERFEAVYPTLKEIALAGSLGSKATKQVSHQILPYSVRAMQENNPALTKEAVSIFIWCLAQNPDNYKQWEKLHLENVDASISVLRKLSDEWKEHSATLSPFDALRETLIHLRAMNEKTLHGAADDGTKASIKEADKYCKVLLGRVTHCSTCMKSGVFLILLAVALGFILSPNVELLDRKWFHAMLSSLPSLT